MIDKNKNEEVIVKRTEDGELVVSSRRVAEDFGKRHADVIEKIVELIKTENSVMSMFIGSSYKAGTGKSYKEYLLTRDGFSLLVMGFTGAKALEWKLKYIEAFNKMEQAIKNPFAHLSQELRAIISIDAKIQEIEEEFNDFKGDMPLFNVDCKELQAAVKKKGIEVLGGYRSTAYCNNSLRSRTYKDIQFHIKREFGVSRYEAIKRKHLSKAIEIVKNYKTPFILEDEITMCNNQSQFNI